MTKEKNNQLHNGIDRKSRDAHLPDDWELVGLGDIWV